MTLFSSLNLDHRDNLGTKLHQFCLGNSSETTQKIMKARVDQHQLIVGGGGGPTLVDVVDLTPPNGVSLLETLFMLWITHMRLRVVLDNFLRRGYPYAHGMEIFGKALTEQEREMEEYYPRYLVLRLKLPALFTQWVRIHLL